MDYNALEPLENDPNSLQESLLRHLRYSLGKEFRTKTIRDIYLALTLSLRDRLMEKLLETEARYQAADAKRLYYLSMEFLIGRSLGINLTNLGIFEACHSALIDMGIDLEEVREQETDAALGNGGLGRLAACFLDSLATLDYPGFGYGIHYEYGLFKQEIDNGYQKEKPDHWLSKAGPFQIERSDESCIIPLYGRIEHGLDLNGNYNPMWMDWRVIIGVPHDIPIVGYGAKTVNYLRLYAAKPSSDFDIQIFNAGDYFRAVEQKIKSETVSKILYPSDTFDTGKELRLVQEYFLVACSLRDIIRRYLKTHQGFDGFPDKVNIQMNDTHPALAVAELMRILVDEHSLEWEAAWNITQKTLAYTNHTLLSEALEKWPVGLLEHVLPRHLQIIYEINHRFLSEIAVLWPDDPDRLRRMSLIEEGDEKQVRMAHLAIMGSHSVNGVSALHTDLIKTSLVPDFFARWPERFNNKTNGITQRRWLLKANPLLADLLNETVGSEWITDLSRLQRLEPFASDPAFQDRFRKIKRANKEQLGKIIYQTTRLKISPDSLFDIHAKRIHEYKRQLLNVMHIIHDYFRIIEDGFEPAVPKTYIFAGKAAPGYWAAKQIIKLIHNVGDIIHKDRRIKDKLKVVFIPDYRVSLAEKIIPAAEVSEQISTAGTEASGTGNMKFALNGSLTIGTLDGANVEMLEEVGEDNIYIFGLKTREIQEMKQTGSYRPLNYYHEHDSIRRVMDAFWDNRFCPHEPGLFRWLYHHILEKGDNYFHLADFLSYSRIHETAYADYLQIPVWNRKSILNVARIGKFSSDRTISEYAGEIWDLTPVH
ncbi:MAG: glycogen/starch/alpha-glucan phosphorylase [Deltaproteobacteria bacterium]|nr:glycogen/starch/alpha-glucan phosphorylase [Deltaproteobacteria bacterium]